MNNLQNNNLEFNEFEETKVPPQNYLLLAILTTFFCCLPIGVYAIIKSTSVNTLWTQGQYELANKASQEAKKWSIIAIISGIVGIILYFVFIFSFIGAAYWNDF